MLEVSTPEDEHKIIWIGGYPFVDGVNAPPGTTSDDPIEQQLLDDVQWEAATELTGWAKVQAFINRVLGGQHGDAR